MNTKAVQVRYEQAIVVGDGSCAVADVFLTTVGKSGNPLIFRIQTVSLKVLDLKSKS
jgi:hypothetical protein